VDFEIRGDQIDLGQLLKASGLAASGGEAKAFLGDGLVRVNGEPEARRGRTLRAGDAVEVRRPGEAPVVITVTGGETP
jgi:ribosome-associated protein